MNQKVVIQNFIIEPTGDKYFTDLFITTLSFDSVESNLRLYFFVN